MVLKAYEAGVHRPEFGVFALVRTEDGLAVGGMGFHGAPDEEGRVEVGYDLVEGARGHGYATRGAERAVGVGPGPGRRTTVVATVEADNVALPGACSRAPASPGSTGGRPGGTRPTSCA